ncbi:MAG: HD domain-containing protein [Bacillota bacterium]|mgnify:FL=1|nr:HD domain-containing protein [Bacillota bacterium]
MPIIDLNAALELNKISQGMVYINDYPVIRTGKKSDFMIGNFINQDQEVEFRIWEPEIFKPVVANGPGIYDAEVVGNSFNDKVYLTVRSIAPSLSQNIKKSDFLNSIPRIILDANWQRVRERLSRIGVSDACWALLDDIINDPALDGRFQTEGAAIRHHDNLIGGLFHHTTKMLRILAALLENNPELLPSADLLCFAIVVHDIGKVFEYDNLEVAPYWYSSHRIRGIEYLAAFAERIIGQYNEDFYRQVQSVIVGHHGEYGDRPTTVAAAIIHYIDTLESQTTRLLQELKASEDGRLYDRDWGFLQGLPLGEK